MLTVPTNQAPGKVWVLAPLDRKPIEFLRPPYFGKRGVGRNDMNDTKVNEHGLVTERLGLWDLIVYS